MSPNVPKTSDSQTARREQGPTVEQLARAVALCCDDTESDERIARKLKIARRTLARWKHHELWGPMHLAVSSFYSALLDKAAEDRFDLRHGRGG